MRAMQLVSPKSNLRDDDSLFLYQERVKSKASAPVQVLLPHSVADELRKVPQGSLHSIPTISSGAGAASVRAKCQTGRRFSPKSCLRRLIFLLKLFLDVNGRRKPAHLHMLRDTFAVEYLLAGMPLEEVSRLLGHSSVTDYPEALCSLGTGETATSGCPSARSVGEHGR